MKLKKVSALILAGALLCGTFAGCGNAGNTGSTASTATVSGAASTAGGTGDAAATALFQKKTVDNAKNINIRAGMEPKSLNTLKATYSIEFSIFKHLYENLYMLDETDTPQLAAAESVDINEDKTMYTFHLRKDGKWTNGDPVTAKDFEFAWKMALDPTVASSYNYFLYFLKNGEAYNLYQNYAADKEGWAADNVGEEPPAEVKWEDVGVKVKDDYTLEVTLENSLPYTEFLFTFGTLAPVNQKFYEAVGADAYNTEAQFFCTNGAYALTDWSHQDKLIMQKNDAYHNAANYEVEQITWKVIAEPQAALTAFLSGELDMTELGNGEVIQQAKDQGKEVQTYNDGGAFYIYFNCTNKYLSNENLRRALALGFDKQGMLDTVHKNADTAMTSFTPAGVLGFDGKEDFRAALEAKNGGPLMPANGDVEKAKEYLAKALEELGCTVDDLTANLSIDCGDNQTSQSEAAFYQEQWRKNLGFTVTVKPMITKEAAQNRMDGNYVMSLTGWGPDYNDPITFLDLWVTGGGNNQTGFSDTEYDEMINAARTETDYAKRQENFYRCEEIIADKYPVAPSWWRTQAYVVSDKLKSGYTRSMFQDLNVSRTKLS